MTVVPLDSPAAWADAIGALPQEGPLPARTVLVPSERHAHALRRALVRGGRAALLAGTRLVGPLTAAAEVLAAAGVPFSPGEEALRPGRLLALFRGDLALEHYPLDLLRSTRGWDDAFSSAVAVLEAAGLRPEDLPGDLTQARDLASVWSRIAAEAGSSWSSARVLAEAAVVLERDPGAWPFPGAAVAAVSGHESAAAARFLRAIPELTLCVWRVRPAIPRHLSRLERLFGVEARRAVEAPAAPAPSHGSAAGAGSVPPERELLAAYLFERPEVLADRARPCSAGPDGTVHLEEHAGVDAELDAAAEWVARKVLEDGLPLEDVAVLVPARDPLARLVAERLERLPFQGGTLPVHVAGGVPAISTAAGARVLAVLRALGAHLSAETLAAVLPALRIVEAPPGEGEGDRRRSHLTHGEATELAYSLGTVGGNAAWPEGALAWSARAAARVGELERALAHAHEDEDSSSREAWQLARTLRNLRAIRPALDALVAVARTLVDRAPLSSLRDALGAFLAEWLLAPGEGAAIPARLAESLAPACAGALGGALTGADALDLVEDHLAALRVSKGRFGEPAVYVGTVESAAGLDFAAVRVVGLSEGVLPSSPRENPVLPESLRGALEAAAPNRVVAATADHVAAQLHALFAVVRGTRASLAFSAPRVDLARTEREPGAIFMEAAAALARPNAVTGEAARPVPDGAAIRRDAFEPARADATAFRAARPVAEASWLDRVARTAPDLPPGWSRDDALGLVRVEALRAPAAQLGPGDGVLAAGDPFPPVPGVGPERPISASALQQLLECPRMFLMRRILHWEEPAGPPSLRELDAISYGSLLHHAVEELYRAHGAEIVARKRSRAHWVKLALDIGDRLFDELLSEYPLVGGRIRDKERERLRRSLRAFVEYDWDGAEGRRFVGVELPFGEPTPLAVEAGGETIHVRGYVDRVDVDGRTTLVRDLKSGRAYPRREGDAPEAVRDVQIGLYQLAARRLAEEWGTPAKVVAAYAYASGRGHVVERAFVSDAAALEEATRSWLATAARLLRDRAFPPSPDEGDCTYCPFRPLCGTAAVQRASEGLEEADDGGPLARFRALKLGEEGEG